MAGEEASFIVVSDGQRVLPLATSQDHKRIGDGDTGPNTGGMGAYSPAPVVTPNVHARVMHEIVLPTIAGMAADGHPFSGFLYAGLMIDAQGNPRVVEFNARLGDPEAQVLLMRLKTDLFDVLMAATASGDAPNARQRRAAVGPPRRARRGDGRARLPGPRAQRRRDRRPAAGHRRRHGLSRRHRAPADGTLVTGGGRVLCVTALGDSVKTAQQRAYAALAPIRFDGAQYRSDIGHRALKPR